MRNAGVNLLFLTLGLAVGFLLWGMDDDQRERAPSERHALRDEHKPRTVTSNPVVKAHETTRGYAETTPAPVPDEQA